MTLNELKALYNRLDSAAFSRSGAPIAISPALAREVRSEVDAFRRWAAEQGPAVDIFPSSELQGWLDTYRRLRAALVAAGNERGRALPSAATERANPISDVATDIATEGGRGVAIGVGVVLALFALMSARK